MMMLKVLVQGKLPKPTFGQKDLLGCEESNVPFLQADCASRTDENYHII